MWNSEEKAKLDDLYSSAIGSDNTDYILEKLTEIYDMIWNEHISFEEKDWELIAVEKRIKLKYDKIENKLYQIFMWLVSNLSINELKELVRDLNSYIKEEKLKEMNK